MIVVCTPTGQIGRQLVADLLDAGAPVRVITRDPARLDPLFLGRVEVVQGSLADASVLADALSGADSVFWLLPPDPTSTDPVQRALDFTRPLCEAIGKQSVRRLVYVGGLGHQETADTDTMGKAMGELIDQTGVSYRTLRMPAFMENLLWQIPVIKHQGVFLFPVNGDLKLPTCATRDIATVAARTLLDDSWTGRDYIPVLGPADISHNDEAQILSEVLGRPVRYQQVPAEVFKANLIRTGTAEASAQWLADLLTAIDGGLYNAEPRTPEATTATTFRQWAEDVFKPAFLA
ncbi:NmrA family NAD(P)-binding protein [Frankia sp. AgKG'84/4]|uniref:NmrA family NAD(P)-binding protein n=1 Tax=Frankia sp. AgKG'84/4 TaxID=573490 RepID=UPI00200EE784|nr:NAD(P)H-binding protein [Frankia sp. AgKG'84/4]MCL9797632.1 NAD(P)H-binding protein [Frankia sp. AgKG'84/4]